MRPRTLRDLPPTYSEAFSLHLLTPRLLLRLYGGSLALAGLAYLFFEAVRQVQIRLEGFPIWVSLPADLHPIVGLLCLVGVLLLHEAVHGAVILFYGHRPRFGIKWQAGALYATVKDGYFWRNQYLAVALAPLLVISALAVWLILISPPAYANWWVALGVINGSGAIGDVYMAWVLRRFPAQAVIRDEEDGFCVFLAQPAEQVGIQGA
jgi:hypothetical protein